MRRNVLGALLPIYITRIRVRVRIRVPYPIGFRYCVIPIFLIGLGLGRLSPAILGLIVTPYPEIGLGLGFPKTPPPSGS